MFSLTSQRADSSRSAFLVASQLQITYHKRCYDTPDSTAAPYGLKVMGWDSELKTVIQRDFQVGEHFTLDEIYEYQGHFSELYPDNRHVEDKLRQTLQHLRDDGIIEFVDRGIYKRLQ